MVDQKLEVTANADAWNLHFGVKRGERGLRDVCEPITLPSLEACREEIVRERQHFDRLGVSIWFATARGPKGQEINLSELAFGPRKA